MLLPLANRDHRWQAMRRWDGTPCTHRKVLQLFKLSFLGITSHKCMWMSWNDITHQDDVAYCLNGNPPLMIGTILCEKGRGYEKCLSKFLPDSKLQQYVVNPAYYFSIHGKPVLPRWLGSVAKTLPRQGWQINRGLTCSGVFAGSTHGSINNLILSQQVLSDL